MLYLLFVLTFLAGILFYGMSPRDDKLQMDAHQAEGMIISFINQHQAAKDYLYTWLGAGPRGGGNSNTLADGFLKEDFENMMWGIDIHGMKTDLCEGNSITANKTGSCFVSQTVCLNAAGGEVNCNSGATRRYVMTYGGWGPDYSRPNWWPSKGQRMRRFESWRKAISKRTRDSVSCGFLFSTDPNPMDSTWCIDNGETAYKKGTVCQNPVPQELIAKVCSTYNIAAAPYNPIHDLLFCYSKFKEGLPGDYVSGATYFYDGFSNVGFGEHQEGNGAVAWRNLAAVGNIENRTFDQSPYCSWGPLQDTGITLASQYTLTVILAIPQGNEVIIFGANNGGTTKPIFKKNQAQLDGTEAFQLSSIDQGVLPPTPIQSEASACNMNSGGNAKDVISWTFVVNGQDITVYENTTRRGWFSGKTIIPTNGSRLMLGGNGARVYAIRYYASNLTHEQIVQNFKVDQKRFGLGDVNNGKQVEVDETDPNRKICVGVKTQVS